MTWRDLIGYLVNANSLTFIFKIISFFSFSFSPL